MPQIPQGPDTGGLMSSAPPPPQVAPPGPVAAPTPTTQTNDAQQASPEEQAMFDAFVKNTLKIVYLKPTWAEFKNDLAENDPVKGIGDTLSIVVDQVVQSAAQNGTALTRDSVVYGLGDVVSQVVADLEEAGLDPLTEDQMAGIVYRVADMVRAGMQKRGELDQQSVQQDWAQLQQMNQSGALAAALGQQQKANPGKASPMNRKQRRALAASKTKGVPNNGY